MHPFYSFFNADVNLLLYYSSIPAANLSEGRIIPSEQSSKLQVKFSTKKLLQNPTSQPFSQPDSTAVAKSNSMSWLKALDAASYWDIQQQQPFPAVAFSSRFSFLELTVVAILRDCVQELLQYGVLSLFEEILRIYQITNMHGTCILQQCVMCIF